jgi:hypothetical protein
VKFIAFFMPLRLLKPLVTLSEATSGRSENREKWSKKILFRHPKTMFRLEKSKKDENRERSFAR